MDKYPMDSRLVLAKEQVKACTFLERVIKEPNLHHQEETYVLIDRIRDWMGFEAGRPMYQNVQRYGPMALYLREVYTRAVYHFYPRVEWSADPYTDEEYREMEQELEDEQYDHRDDDPEAYCY